MCGICGVVLPTASDGPSRETLSRMADRIRHRGPDGEGFHLGPGVGLGHRRLAVIDLEGGRQPMYDPTGRLAIVFNGEIYNFRELRAELEGLGDRFRTTSDTEVLLSGYARWGEAVLPRLVGMFAFALWDSREQSLLLARDRLGVKPLYWTRTRDGALVFGSELSAVTAHEDVEARLDPQALAYYVAHGYVPGKAAILAGVERLRPGHLLAWRRGGEPTVRCWYDLAAVWARTPRTEESPAAQLERFEALVATAVRQRLVSDVPLGALLSGGLDSSAVTALMTRELPRVLTFSMGFTEASYDELPYARLAAKALGTVHQDERDHVDRPELLQEVADVLDEPFADTSILPTYALARMARKHVTVVLSGDGGDELLAGYVTQRATALHPRLQSLPRWVRALLRGSVGLLPDSRRKVNAVFKAKRFLAGGELAPVDAHASWRQILPPEALPSLLRGRGAAAAHVYTPFREAFERTPTLEPLDRFLYVDYETWLADDILVKVDRASMAHGLEARSPFLDHRLVEFCASLPPDQKRRGNVGKVLLRSLAKTLVPKEILTRRKAGFNAPVAQWLVGPWRDLVADVLSPARVRDMPFFDAETVARLRREHEEGRRDHGYLLFMLLMFGLWFRRVRPALP